MSFKLGLYRRFTKKLSYYLVTRAKLAQLLIKYLIELKNLKAA